MNSLRSLLACAGLAMVAAVAADAQEGCTASCSCPCQPDAEQCSVLVCNAPSIASCHDGSCGADSAKCCCSQTGRAGRGCVPYDCGDWPLYQCAKAAGDLGSAGRRAAPPEEATAGLCRALRQMDPDDDLWSYAELAAAAPGGVQRYRIRFASDPDYAVGLQRCAELGLAFDEDRETSDKPAFLFRFRAPRGSSSPNGLHAALNVPAGPFGALSGALAIQLKVTGAGQILAKKLLFSTDAELGKAVLAGIDRWFSAAPGNDLASYEDVLFLHFEAGKLGMAVEHHHTKRAKTA